LASDKRGWGLRRSALDATEIWGAGDKKGGEKVKIFFAEIVADHVGEKTLTLRKHP